MISDYDRNATEPANTTIDVGSLYYTRYYDNESFFSEIDDLERMMIDSENKSNFRNFILGKQKRQLKLIVKKSRRFNNRNKRTKHLRRTYRK